MQGLFNKSAMESMATPEQLDQQTKIVKPYLGLGIFSAVILFICIIIWACFGSINSTVHMERIIFPKSGVASVVAPYSGKVQDVLYDIGDSVREGDIIAIIPDTQLQEEIVQLQNQVKKGNENKELQEKLKLLYEQYESKSVIRSTSDGVIQNIIQLDQVVQEGENIADILVKSQYTNNRQIVAYVPLRTAKRMEVGMETQICPSYVSREEYGYMEGYISYIGEIPVTEESLMNYYGNLEYVSGILPEESCVEICISVHVDEESDNLFRWSSEKGKELSVEVGTVCNIQTIIQENRPIDLIF